MTSGPCGFTGHTLSMETCILIVLERPARDCSLSCAPPTLRHPIRPPPTHIRFKFHSQQHERNDSNCDLVDTYSVDSFSVYNQLITHIDTKYTILVLHINLYTSYRLALTLYRLSPTTTEKVHFEQ
jgi:hypothetical protein